MTPPSGGPAAAPPLTVVVCTFNRSRLLAECLRSLAAQTAPPGTFEVVVVDNNSTDDTAWVAAAWALEHGNVRVVAEARQGLSHARNRGAAEARGEYVGYLDDDGTARPEWVAVAREIIASRRPAAFGGPYHARYEGRKPVWWRDAYRSFRPHDAPRALAAGESLSGGNLFVRKDLLAAAGGFDPGLGMAGARVAIGEETRLLREIRRLFPDAPVWYDPRLAIDHLVHPAKMRWRWLVRYWFAAGRDSWRVFQGNAPPEERGRLLAEGARTVAATGTSVLRAFLFRDRSAYPHPQNFLFEVTSRHVVALGALRERLARSGEGAPP